MVKGRDPSAPIDELVLRAVDQLGAEDDRISNGAHHDLLKYGPAAAQAVADALVVVPRDSRFADAAGGRLFGPLGGKVRSLWYVLEKLGPAAASVASMLVKLLVADEDPEAAGVIASMG